MFTLLSFTMCGHLVEWTHGTGNVSYLSTRMGPPRGTGSASRRHLECIHTKAENFSMNNQRKSRKKHHHHHHHHQQQQQPICNEVVNNLSMQLRSSVGRSTCSPMSQPCARADSSTCESLPVEKRNLFNANLILFVRYACFCAFSV